MATATDTRSARAAQRDSAPDSLDADILAGDQAPAEQEASGPDAARMSTGTSAATDPHVAWGRRWREISRRLIAEDLNDEEEPGASLWDERDRIENLVAATPARTPEGVREQVRLALDCAKDPSLDPPPLKERDIEERALRNALATLDRMAEEA